MTTPPVPDPATGSWGPAPETHRGDQGTITDADRSLADREEAQLRSTPSETSGGRKAHR